MPYVYTDSLATAGNLTTSATANAETETWFLKPAATRTILLAGVFVAGKNAAKTALDAIVERVRKWGTASTGGTGLSSIAKDGSAPSATATSGSRPTSGTTATNTGPIVSCGTTSPGFWVTENWDRMISLAAGNAGSISGFDSSATGGLVFEFSLEHFEV